MVLTSKPQANKDILKQEDFKASTTSSVANWSSSVQSILDQPPSTLPMRVVLGGTVFCLLVGTWAWLGQIDEVARATGKLIPKGEVYRIHSTNAGRLIRIAVQEGQAVQAGQILAELDTELPAKEVERLEQLLQSSQMELLQTQNLLDQTRLQTETRAAIAATNLQMQQVAIAQAKDNATANEDLLAQYQTDADAQLNRLQRIRPLAAQGAISEEHLFGVEQQLRDRQRTITERQNALEQTRAESDRLQIELSQKQAEADQSLLEAQQQVQQLEVKVTELHAKVQETQALLAAAKTKLDQQYLRSPVDGIVLTLHTRRDGIYAQPEQAIAEIAPQGKPLILSTVLPSSEAGFVKTGMSVKVKLDAYPYQDYGVLSGQVMSISPDSKPDDRLGSVYRVEVALDRNSIKAQGQTVSFKAGQTATAEIVTRRRRIADILLDPLKKLQQVPSL